MRDGDGYQSRKTAIFQEILASFLNSQVKILLKGTLKLFDHLLFNVLQ